MIEGKHFFTIRGHQKSGTNWIARLLNSHPQISCTGEFHWERITSQLIANFHESGMTRQPGLLDAVWQSLDRFIKESMVQACDKDAVWVGDRTPSHIEPSIIIGARNFNVIRDGRDVVVSFAYHVFNNFDTFPEFQSSNELQETLRRFQTDKNYFLEHPTELLASDELLRDSIFHWNETIEKNQAAVIKNPEIPTLDVRYESVHRDAESTRREMFDFLEVDPDLAAPLEVDAQAGFKREQADQFLRKGAVGDWKNYFTPRVQDIFNQLAGQSLLQLGYAESLNYEIGLDPTTGKTLAPLRAAPAVVSDNSTENLPQAQDLTVDLGDRSPDDVANTAALMSKAAKLLAYGGLDGVVQRPLFDFDGGAFPHFARSAAGCRIVDSMGRSYVDWMNGWGPVMLGYNHPEIASAIESQFSAGPTLSLMHPVEVEVAELLVEMIPCAEMVAFGKNGSDSVNAALRIARAVTGQKMILQCGFHGFHEWYTCLHPNVEGMPDGLREQVDPFPYNDLEALEAKLIQHQGAVAAVMMEPVNLQIPDPDYLAGVRRLTQQHGCLLIFDEMVTAFRLANGGAQEYFGVVPDLCCVGKAMANGMPLSAIVGKREYMQRLPACGFGMTFRGETFSLVAAKTVLQLLKREPVCKHIAEIGRRTREAFLQISERLGVKCVLAGPEARMTIEFHDCGDLPQAGVRSLFLQECLKNGVITNGTLLPGYAHDDQAIAESMIGFESALRSVAVAIESSRIDSTRPVGGSPTGPRAFVSNGFLESVHREQNQVMVHGWMLLEDGAPDSIEFIGANGHVVPASICQRDDLEKAFPSQPTAARAGYGRVVAKRIVPQRRPIRIYNCGQTCRPSRLSLFGATPRHSGGGGRTFFDK